MGTLARNGLTEKNFNYTFVNFVNWESNYCIIAKENN